MSGCSRRLKSSRGLNSTAWTWLARPWNLGAVPQRPALVSHQPRLFEAVYLELMPLAHDLVSVVLQGDQNRTAEGLRLLKSGNVTKLAVATQVPYHNPRIGHSKTIQRTIPKVGDEPTQIRLEVAAEVIKRTHESYATLNHYTALVDRGSLTCS